MVQDSLIGRVVDARYEIVDRVARGGMATVYRARDRRLDRTVALKVMHAHLAESDDFVARFRREARAAARLSNPGVVAVYDQGSIDAVAYLVMEYVEGPTLRDLMAAGPLSVKEALGYTVHVLRPLSAAHRAGLVHRDIKPENVLLPEDGSAPKVADFGLARAVTEATQTSTGNVLGTVAYLAPELITTGTSSARADVFAVGVMLYEMLTGVQPFGGETPIHIAFRNVHDDIPPPSLLVAGLPPAVDGLVAALTAREPANRPEDADEALSLVRSVRDDLTEVELAIHRSDRADGEDENHHTRRLPARPVRKAKPVVDAGQASAAASSGRAGGGSTDELEVGRRTVSLPVGSIGAGGEETAADAPPTHEGEGEAGSGRPVRRRHLLAAVLLLGGAGAAGGGGYWYVTQGPGRRIAVPSVEGLKEAEAQSQVEAADLVWRTGSREYSDTVAQGQVVSVSPAPGSHVAAQTVVTAVVSLGVEQKAVPDVVGTSTEDAKQTILDAGLAVGEVTEEYSDTVAEGQVVSTDPVAGSTVNHSSAVAIVVSQGRQPVSVPDVTGKSQAEAEAALTTAGLAVGDVTQAYSDTVAQGYVISSDPAAGSPDVLKGDGVSLVVSQGPEMVTVPDVTGKSEQEARSDLEGAGLVVSVSRVLGGLFGTARSTDPAAGASVRKGSTVTLYIV